MGGVNSLRALITAINAIKSNQADRGQEKNLPSGNLQMSSKDCPVKEDVSAVKGKDIKPVSVPTMARL